MLFIGISMILFVSTGKSTWKKRSPFSAGFLKRLPRGIDKVKAQTADRTVTEYWTQVQWCTEYRRRHKDRTRQVPGRRSKSDGLAPH